MGVYFPLHARVRVLRVLNLKSRQGRRQKMSAGKKKIERIFEKAEKEKKRKNEEKK